MENLNNNDPVFLETCHRWLLFHYHCNNCGQTEDACEYGKVCSYGKSAFTHVRGCTRGDCSFPRCDFIKSIIRHHMACKDADCKVCAPVCNYQARRSPQAQPQLAGSPAQPPSPPLAPAASFGMQAANASQRLQPAAHPPRPPPQSPQQPQSEKRSSTVAELDGATETRPGGVLFEARHREHKRHMASTSASRAPAEAAAVSGPASASCSGTSSGGCALACAPSGSLDAVAEMQALQLDKPSSSSTSSRQPQPPSQPPQQLQQPGALPACAARPPQPYVRLSALASLPHTPAGSSNTGNSGPPPAGEATQQQPPHPHPHQQPQPQPQPAGTLSAFQLTPGMQHQQLGSGLSVQQQPHAGMQYGTTALTVLLPHPNPQQQPVASVLHAHDQQSAHPQQPLPFARQAMFGPLHFIAPAGFPAGPQLHVPPPPQQQQHPHKIFGGDGAASLPSNSGLPITGALALQATAPQYLQLPYGTLVQQLGAPAPGMSYTFVHHHYGATGQAPTVLLPPPSQPPPVQHPHLAPLQQQPQGLLVGSGPHSAPTGAGYVIGPQTVPGLLPIHHLGGSAAAAGIDASGGASTGTATAAPSAWGLLQPAGLESHPQQVASAQPLPHPHLPQQQHPQLPGHFPPVGPAGSGVEPVVLAQQVAGAT